MHTLGGQALCGLLFGLHEIDKEYRVLSSWYYKVLYLVSI